MLQKNASFQLRLSNIILQKKPEKHCSIMLSGFHINMARLMLKGINELLTVNLQVGLSH